MGTGAYVPILHMNSPADFGPIELRTDDPHQSLVLEAAVLSSLAGFQQHDANAPEAGGMLFATIERQCVRIKHASTPHPEDKRSRARFIPNLTAQKDEIARQFSSGLHFVGEWHSHPERYPTPSQVDLQSMDRCFSTSRHALKAFVMVIVGTAPWPNCLWVSLHRSGKAIQLFPT